MYPSISEKWRNYYQTNVYLLLDTLSPLLVCTFERRSCTRFSKRKKVLSNDPQNESEEQQAS